MGLFDIFKKKKKIVSQKDIESVVERLSKEDAFNKDEQVIIDKILSESMDEYMNRPVYDVLTKEILTSLDDDKIEQAVIDNIFGKDESELNSGQLAMMSSWIVEGEVDNGGFNQFYYNSKDKYSQMAIDGFKLLGATPFAELMEKANSIYETIKDYIHDEDDSIEAFSESYNENPLNPLDDEFYKLSEEMRLSDLRVKYIKENMDDFCDN